MKDFCLPAQRGRILLHRELWERRRGHTKRNSLLWTISCQDCQTPLTVMRKHWKELLQVLKHQEPRGAQRCNGNRNPEQPPGAGEDQQHHHGHWPWLALWQMSCLPPASTMRRAGDQTDPCDWLETHSHWQNPSAVAFSTHKQVISKWSLPTAFLPFQTCKCWSFGYPVP